MRPACALAAIALLTACASPPPPPWGQAAPEPDLGAQVAAVLERRGLGGDALLVIDNVLRHGAPAPRAAPAGVLEILGRPLAAADAARIFSRLVPSSFESASTAESFEDLLAAYLAELFEAQRLLRAATRDFEDAALLRRLQDGLPSANQLLAVEAAVDAPALERANALFVAATVRFARSIPGKLPGEARRFESAIGTVVIGTHGDDRHGPAAALIIDPGGDDVYERAPARGGAVSVIVDLGGNDRYAGSDLALRGLSAIVDLAGDDRYAMRGSGLAAAIAGASLLLDYAGDDTYEAKFFAQGAAAFGFAALVDFSGADRYRLQAWGQGFGLGGGVGLLWDRAGDDRYLAGGETDPFNRGGGMSGAQGAAFGWRGVLAGGVGILRDDAGDDHYEAELFGQGIGYYYGLGLLWDRAGNDRYRAIRYAQGNGVHQAVGVLQDDAGDDHYAISLGYGQGMGLDLGVGALLDAGGDDVYRAHYGAQGAATANGFGLLVDARGADRFELGPDAHAWGRAEWLRGLPSVGLLLHGAGARFEQDGKTIFIPAGNRGGPLGDSAAEAEPPPARCAPGAWSYDEALVCLLRDAPDTEAAAQWNELEALLAAEPATPLAVPAAVALRLRPPAPAQAARVAALLDRRESCALRAMALRAWPTAGAAQSGLRSDCWRLQSAARAAFEHLGEAHDPGAALPSFLRGLPSQDDPF